MTKRRNLFEELKEGIASLAAQRGGVVAKLPLRPIGNEIEYDQAVIALNALLDAGGADEHHALGPLVDAVGDLVAEYEARNKHIGSSFDDFLKQEGRLDEATETARKRLEQIKRK